MDGMTLAITVSASINIVTIVSMVYYLKGKVESIDKSLNKRIDDLKDHVDKRIDDIKQLLSNRIRSIEEIVYRES